MKAITHEELKAFNNDLKKDFLLLNVLPQEDFKDQHIRTSANVPLDQDNFTEMVEMLAGDKTRDIVVYCANFECPLSKEAADKLEKAGFRSVYDYQGGTKDWFDHKQAA